MERKRRAGICASLRSGNGWFYFWVDKGGWMDGWYDTPGGMQDVRGFTSYGGITVCGMAFYAFAFSLYFRLAFRQAGRAVGR